MRLISSLGVPPSPARTRAPGRTPFRIGAVQADWRSDPVQHQAQLREGVLMASDCGAQLVALQELTLSPYFASTEPESPLAAAGLAEDLLDGPTFSFCRAMARESGAYVHASLYERAEPETRLGYNTAIVVAPEGGLVSRTRKLHIPITAGYYEDRYFRRGPAADAFPVAQIGQGRFGFPTCWDQWFGEVSRAYALAGAEVLVYPTAIGSEPNHPGFDTEPLWRAVMVGQGIGSGLFMVAINRFGDEGLVRFYGGSFISDPYGRILVQAPRDQAAVLVADLDLDQRRDWLELFPLLKTRRPDAYGDLVTYDGSP